MNERQISAAVENPANSADWLSRVFFALMGCGVALGAFGAHALRDARTPAQIETWKTATLYLLVHALSGALLSMFSHTSSVAENTDGQVNNGLHVHARLKIPHSSLWLFLAGCIVFAGSLYALVLTQISLLGAITPLGGLMFIAGWLNLAVRTKRA